jgi:hypothetical protein
VFQYLAHEAMQACSRQGTSVASKCAPKLASAQGSANSLVFDFSTLLLPQLLFVVFASKSKLQQNLLRSGSTLCTGAQVPEGRCALLP